LPVLASPVKHSPTIGRFELKRELGQGAQATVWLAFDGRLEREVAVKLMHAGAAEDALAVHRWLQEARSVSRLTHPNIVPVFEADLHAQQPYLVFEYVAGPTLAQHMKARGALPVADAVAMMVGVLDALHVAHAAGVVHRDLKPSNILVDASGRARVMDFGIAGRVNDPGSADQVVGTPGYMSPEATRGGLPAPTMDVFSAGVVLIEMLSGERLVTERDPGRAMQWVTDHDLALPAGLTSEVDDALRALLLRAIARDPARRCASAGDFGDALRRWLMPTPPEPDEAAAAAAAGSASGTLDFLLRRMRHKTDFPALSDSIARIQQVTSSDNESLGSLSTEILKDVALTNKLLRLVNTAHYSQAGGAISTVSRAVALIGFSGVRNMAMSLLLLEHMHDKAHANQLKEDFVRSLMAGMLASELSGSRRESEEAFIGAMFQNLGRMLSEFYFPEEARQVRAMVAGAVPLGAAGGISEEVAAVRVLGLGFEAIGLGVAKSWGLPETLQQCMRKPRGEPPGREPTEPGERMRWIGHAANQITDALLRAEPAQGAVRVADLARRYARAIGLTQVEVEVASVAARKRLAETAQAMGLQLSAQSPARRLLTVPVTLVSPPPGDAPTIRESRTDGLVAHALQATVTIDAGQPRTALENAAEVLAAGIQDITNSMVEDFKLNDVLRMVLETMYRALGFRRVVFCLRDAKLNAITGRFGLGDRVQETAAHFKVPLNGEGDLFTAVCMKGADTLIADATVAHIAARLPAWYRSGVNAPAFLVLPMQLKGAPFAMIYADKAVAGGIELGEKELSLLRTLRNQAVMAFKQAAVG
jgi:eukaryotic-like serine/threonine-protein kinase